MINWILLFLFFSLVYLGACLFFYFYQESFLFHPRSTAQDFEYDFNYPYEEKWYDTSNNSCIHTLKFSVKDSKGLVFYLHGNAGSLRDWGWVYTDFISRGYDLLILDYRTFGKSKGKLSEQNMVNDACFVFDQVSETYPKENIVIYGRSIGTGVALQLAAQRKAKGLILESPFYSIADIASKIAPIFPVKLLLRFKFESYSYINQVNYPTYIIHGVEDKIVPFSSGNKLAQEAKNETYLIPVQEAQHDNLSDYLEFSELLNKVLVK